jgi:hypothetical protein
VETPPTMTVDILSAMIARDLEAQEPNWWARPLTKRLPPPVKKKFVNSFKEEELLDLWLVFEETPEPDYKVVYSEKMQMFGLAIEGNDHDVLIGYYGGFIDTMNAM